MDVKMRYFRLEENKTTFTIECVAGMTTFLTMSYIIFVNPMILSHAGINQNAAFVATCLTAAVGSLMMGLIANYPIAIAPAMGMNAYFSYVVVKDIGYSWQAGLGIIFLAALLFLFLTLSNLRQRIIYAIPKSQMIGIAAGIGLFLALIALKNVNIIVTDPNTLVRLGKINNLPAALFFCGFLLMAIMSYYRILGAILIAIVMITLASLLLGISHFHGIVALPPSLKQTFLALDLRGALHHSSSVIVIFTFFLIMLFDSTGTIVGVLQATGFHKDRQHLQKLPNALMADSMATIAGSLLGTSTTTPYIESATGMSAGGRTGITALVVSFLFLCALFFAPLANTIPVFATSAALLFIGCFMVRTIGELDWLDFTEYLPAIFTTLMIPLSFSIADGVGFGLITYVMIKISCKRIKDLNMLLVILALIFVVYFIS